MDITEQVVNQAIADFDGIKAALEKSGVEVPNGTDTSEYAGLIESMADKPYQQGYTDGYSTGSMLIYYAHTLQNLWANTVFPENTELVVRLKNSPIAVQYAFSLSSNLKSIKLIAENIDDTTAINFGYLANKSTELEVIDLTEFTRKISNMNYFIFYCTNLKSILGALDVSACTLFSNSFNTYSKTLEDIEFVPYTIKASIIFSHHPNLTDKSIQSIILGLVDYSGTENAYVYNVYFSPETLARIEEMGETSPNGNKWLDYIDELGWNY